MLDILKLASQCCDADNYLDLGAACAAKNICSGPLRPIGDYYWFSIPFRLGVLPDILVILNLLLLLVSIALATWAMLGIASKHRPIAVSWKNPLVWVIVATSVVIHAIFFYPTLLNTLSDTPANAIFLSATWLLMRSALTTEPKYKAWLLLIAGSCWGVSVLLRAFFLYPVIAGFATHGTIWIFNRNRKWFHLLLLVGLLPISLQYKAMHNLYDRWTFLPDDITADFRNMHLNMPYSGFDTYFPHAPYFWQTRGCSSNYGILNGLQNKQYSDVLCVLKGRLQFYLGTYSPVTYSFPGTTHYLVEGSGDNIGNNLFNWWTDMNFSKDEAIAPSGEKTADRLTVPHAAAGGFGDIKQWIALKGDTHYTFSVWLWSPLPRTVNIAITNNHNERDIVAIKQVQLTPQPQRFSVTGKTRDAALYDAYIGLVNPDMPVTFGTHEGDYLYAWGAQLESSDHATEYMGKAPVEPDRIRQWSNLLLCINLIGATFLLMLIILYRHFYLRKEMVVVLVAVGLAVIESLAIIPEQRFFITPMVLMWITVIVLSVNQVRGSRFVVL